MKKLLIIVFAISLTGFTFSQKSLTTSEFVQQHPELMSTNQSGIGEVIGNSPKKLLNGVTYTYVGSFDGLNGPYYGTNPPCYTGQEAAALLFGGNPSDYVTSTNPSTTDPNTITFTAWMVTWGISGWAEYAQDYKVDVLPVGYDDPSGVGTATSAYVWDNPPPPGSSITYVWRAAQQSIPISNWAIILGVLLIGTFIVVRYRTSLA